MLDRILNGMLVLAKWSLLAIGLAVMVSVYFGFWLGIKAATRGRDYTYFEEEDRCSGEEPD